MHWRFELATYQRQDASGTQAPQTIQGGVRKLLRNFSRLADINSSLGGEAALEWPRTCAYWRERKVLELINRLGLEDVFVDGCALGVVAQHGADAGLPILKPWRIATSCQELRDDFREYRCPGHDRHAPCAGKDTEATGFYTDPFVEVVHKAYKRHCVAPVPTTTSNSSRTPSSPNVPLNVAPANVECLPAAPVTFVGELAERWLHNCVSFTPKDSVAALIAALDNATTTTDFTMVGPNQPHRGALRIPLWNAMVTKALHPSDPMARSARAVRAVDEELAALRSEKVWREDEPLEEEEAKRQFPDAHFAGLHSIVGVKNHEYPSESDHIYKGRVVLGGHDVRDSTGAAAVFNDIGSTPSTMAARAAWFGRQGPHPRRSGDSHTRTRHVPSCGRRACDGTQIALPAEEQQQQQQLPAEHSALDTASTELVDQPPTTAGVKFHDVRPYAGSLRAKFAPWLTSQQWVALGQ